MFVLLGGLASYIMRPLDIMYESLPPDEMSPHNVQSISSQNKDIKLNCNLNCLMADPIDPKNRELMDYLFEKKEEVPLYLCSSYAKYVGG